MGHFESCTHDRWRNSVEQNSQLSVKYNSIAIIVAPQQHFDRSKNRLCACGAKEDEIIAVALVSAIG